MHGYGFFSLTYRYLFQTAATTPCGFIYAGAARKQLCGLLILFYFSVFSAMPLSGIHVEDRSTYIVNILNEQNNKTEEGLLVFLHEMLHLHFKDRTDHSSFPNSHFTEGGQGSRSLKNTQLPKSAAQTIQCPDSYSSVHNDGLLRLLACGKGLQSFKGFHSFSSSLSPPSV